MKFSFLPGSENPSDYMTCPISYKQFIKTNFYKPKFDDDIHRSQSVYEHSFSFLCPNPISDKKSYQYICYVTCIERNLSHVIPLDRYEHFSKLIKVYCRIFQYINKLKMKCKSKRPIKCEKLKVFDENFNLNRHALFHIIKVEQLVMFPEVLKFFNSRGRLKDIPTII